MLAVTEIVYQIGWYHFRHYTSQQVDSPDRISIVFYCYDASPQKIQLNSAGDRGRWADPNDPKSLNNYRIIKRHNQMKKLDRYYLYIFLITFIGSIAPEKGFMFDVSLDSLWKSFTQSLLIMVLVILVLRCLSELISKNIKRHRNE